MAARRGNAANDPGGAQLTPDAAVDRLRDDTHAALGRKVGPGDIVAIAVSGGPDSMALLALAAAAWPGQVIAATVDHGLRPEAAREATMVAGFCASLLSPAEDQSRCGDGGARHRPTVIAVTKPRPAPGNGVPHRTLTPSTPLGPSNLQAAARAARYAVLTEWATANGASILATAHHADDQAETFLMRAARGSGLAGLAGIRPRRTLGDRLTLIRPLLGWRRAELRAIAEASASPFIDDPSNASDRYDRTRFRSWIGEAPWLDPARLARSAAWLAEADADMRALAEWLIEARAVPSAPGACRIDVAGLPREVRRRLARTAIGRVREAGAIAMPAWNDAVNIEPLLDALAAGKSATQAGVMASVAGEVWHFHRAPPRRTG